MDIYALYTFSFTEPESFHYNSYENVPKDTVDKNLWLDRLFGGKKADVRIQKINKNGKGADKYPCTILAHENRVVWLRMENEKSMRIYEKKRSKTSEPDPIEQKEMPTNPFSYIFFDCREGKDMIAIRKNSDAWRSTDVEARLLEESLNKMMADHGYEFGISIAPVTMPKDFWDYNRRLIKKQKRRVKKMTIYFTNGTIDPAVEDFISKIPFLKRLLKETWNAHSGKVELQDPFGQSIVDGRKRDIKNIVELITSNASDTGFGLCLAYDNGMEVTCGKDVRLEYPMETDMLDMLFRTNLFGEYRVNVWLDQAASYIKKQKDEKTIESSRKRKTPKHVQETSALLNFL